MAERWIFQDIKDLQDNVLYVGNYNHDRKVWEENWDNYTSALRAKVSPEVYTMYKLWECDIDVDVLQIQLCVRDVYPVSKSQIEEWIWKHKEPHHFLI